MINPIKKFGKFSEKFKVIIALFCSVLLVLTFFHLSNHGTAKAETKEDFTMEGGIFPYQINKEVEVTINTNNDFPEANLKLSLYKINKDDLFKYVTYDEKGDRINKFLDTDKLDKVTSFEKKVDNTSQNNKISLPIKNQGIYYLEVESKTGFKKTSIFIISRNGTIATEGEDKLIFWNQDLVTGKKVTEGKLSIYNFKNKPNKLKELKPNNQGISETEFNKDYDFAFFEKDNDLNVVRLNRSYLDQDAGEESYFNLKKASSITDNFIFTDRPIYRPGDTVNFKGILRENLNGRTSLTKGNVKVKIRKYDYRSSSESKAIFERTYSLSENSSFDGSMVLDKDISTGDYELLVTKDNTDEQFYSSFSVEYYRKPSYFLETDTKVTEAIAGDTVNFNINGKYFSGNPASNQRVKYKIVKNSASQASYLKDKTQFKDTYPVNLPDAILLEGEILLDPNGYAELPYNVSFTGETNQIIQLETSLEDGSGNPATSSKRFLAYRGTFDIFRNDDYNSSVKTNQNVDIPLLLVKNRPDSQISNINLDVSIKRTWWEEQAFSETGQKFHERNEEFNGPSIKTDDQGKATLSFVPKGRGSYSIKVSGNDERGNKVQNFIYIYAYDELNFYSNSKEKEYITLNTDKDIYTRNGVVNLNINSEIPNIDTLITIFRDNVIRYEVVSLQGKSKTVPINLEKDDIPNVYVNALLLTEEGLKRPSKEIKINTDNKKLNILVSTDKEKYAPGENVTLNLDVKDLEGNPAQTEVTLWLVDKALYELADRGSTNIYNSFWYTRNGNANFFSSVESIPEYGGGYGGCFAGGTKILMEDHTLKNIEEIQIGDKVLTRENERSDSLKSGTVTNTFKHTVTGYFIVNGMLKVTPEHIVNINGKWNTADSINVGDKFVNSNGQNVEVTSKEWVKGKFDVYNFTVENYHTYFADNVYVHNEKGGAPRVSFKDVAYWNPSIKTDINGKAQVTFKLPDNLTTWSIAAIGNTLSSQFGDSKKDIIVSKNIVVIPVLPNILREGDEIKVAAIIQNFTDQDQNLDVTLKTENAGGLDSPDKVNLTLKPNEIKTATFKLKTGAPNDNAKFDFNVQSTKNEKEGDQVILSLPIREYGFFTYNSENAEGSYKYNLKKESNINYDKSSILLGLTPSTLGALPLAFNYLINYPYGCVEQTTSKMVSALLAKKYPEFFSDSTKGVDLDNAIKSSLIRLDNLNTSYGWSFWNTYNEQIDALVTVYALENIYDAKKLGFSVNENELEITANYLVNYLDDTEPIDSRTAAANYGLALVGKFDEMRQLNNEQMNGLNADALALQVMANFIKGEKNPENNGLNLLINRAVVQDELAYFEAGDKKEFGSRDLSTALSLRAIILAGGDLKLAQKLNNYLVVSKKTYYWSNTYATAQAMKAVIEFSKVTSQDNPNYSYQIKTDGKEIYSGNVDKFNTIINPISINYNEINNNSSLEIIKNGNGKLYSNLVYKNFVTDKNYKAKSDKISISREYINAKGEIYNLGLGDIVDVTFKIKSNVGGANYAVLEDQLPAGLVPVNMKLKNEQFNRDIDETQEVTDPSKGIISDFEYTENGILLVIDDLSDQEKTYSYKARVVSEGKFIAPPTFISFMYSPNDNGNTNSYYLETFEKGTINPIKYFVSIFKNYGIIALQTILIIFISVSIIVLTTLSVLRRNNKTMKDVINYILKKVKREKIN